MSERRATQRQRSFLKGTLYFNSRRSSYDCLIRDMSPVGARLAFSAAVTTPEQVELYIQSKDQYYRANVRWRRNDEIGVEFADAQAGLDPGSPPDLPRRVELLEHELAKLSRTVNDLKQEFRKHWPD